MLRTLLSIFAIIICLAMQAETPAYSDRVVDMESAMRLCDEYRLTGPEGLWQLVGSDTRVLIYRKKYPDIPTIDEYDLIAVTPPDLSIETGEIIGKCSPTAEANIYSLEVFTKRNDNGRLSGKKVFLLRIDDTGRVMTSTEERKAGIRFNPLGIFPIMSRILRIYYDPIAKKPRGFRKIYPGIDPDGTLPGQIRIL